MGALLGITASWLTGLANILRNVAITLATHCRDSSNFSEMELSSLQSFASRSLDKITHAGMITGRILTRNSTRLALGSLCWTCSRQYFDCSCRWAECCGCFYSTDILWFGSQDTNAHDRAWRPISEPTFVKPRSPYSSITASRRRNDCGNSNCDRARLGCPNPALVSSFFSISATDLVQIKKNKLKNCGGFNWRSTQNVKNEYVIPKFLKESLRVRSISHPVSFKMEDALKNPELVLFCIFIF